MASIIALDPRYSYPKSEYQKIYFKECAVAGTSFHIDYDDDIWNELHEGVEIALVRDKNNQYDNNAVAIALADDYDGDPDGFDFKYILGYIPRGENVELARMLDAGFDDNITGQITTYRNYGSINNRLRVTIYLRSLKPVIVRPNLLRAETIDLDELQDMQSQLMCKGTVYKRIGGFYDDIKVMLPPIEGEKLVTVFEDSDGYLILYLLRVLATGDKCAAYVDDPEILYTLDDCGPYVFTNVSGPLRIKIKDNPLIADIDLSDLDPMYYLDGSISLQFEKLFGNALQNPLTSNNVDMDPSIDEPLIEK